MTIETICVHGKGKNDVQDNYGAVSVPIYQSATFAHPSLGTTTGFDYTRQSNPTRLALETHVAALEKTSVDGGACAFSSGMAAISAVMDLFSAGDHILAVDDLYGGSIRLFDLLQKQRNISVDFFPSHVNAAQIKSLIRPSTRAIFIETPTNPLMNICDIKGIAKITAEHHLLLIVDNTFMTPFFQLPLELGADIVIHSGSKYLGGHNDTISGFVVAKNKVLFDKIAFISKTTGAGLAPFDSWLILRGIKTLALRMERIAQNALVIAHFLDKHPHVVKVLYPGLEKHPGREMCLSQAQGFGGMISFETDTVDRAVKVLETVTLIHFAESLGGVETLITYPFTQTHAAIPEQERKRRGITDKLLRLSCGIEAAQDIIEDLDKALRS